MNENLNQITGEVGNYGQIPSVNHETPQPDSGRPSLSTVWSQLPIREPVLIQNTLQRYQKMMITGPSKSCKTALAIQLAIAVAEGTSWLENECAKGNVLYLNFDESIVTIYSRFFDTYQALRIEPKEISNITIMNLKGEMTAENEDDFINQVLTLVNGFPYRMIIIDSIDYLFDIGSSGTAIRLNQAIDRFVNKTKICTVLVHSDHQQETKLSSLSECVVSLNDTSLHSETRFRLSVISKTFPVIPDILVDFRYPSVGKFGKYDGSLEAINDGRRSKAKVKFEKAFDELSQSGEQIHVSKLADHLGIARESVYRKVNDYSSFKIEDGIVEKIKKQK